MGGRIMNHESWIVPLILLILVIVVQTIRSKTTQSKTKTHHDPDYDRDPNQYIAWHKYCRHLHVYINIAIQQ
jgi:hypothetical protein